MERIKLSELKDVLENKTVEDLINEGKIVLNNYISFLAKSTSIISITDKVIQVEEETGLYYVDTLYEKVMLESTLLSLIVNVDIDTLGAVYEHYDFAYTCGLLDMVKRNPAYVSFLEDYENYKFMLLKSNNSTSAVLKREIDSVKEDILQFVDNLVKDFDVANMEKALSIVKEVSK